MPCTDAPDPHTFLHFWPLPALTRLIVWGLAAAAHIKVNPRPPLMLLALTYPGYKTALLDSPFCIVHVKVLDAAIRRRNSWGSREPRCQERAQVSQPNRMAGDQGISPTGPMMPPLPPPSPPPAAPLATKAALRASTHRAYSAAVLGSSRSMPRAAPQAWAASGAD